MSEINPLYGGFIFDVFLIVLLFLMGASGIGVLFLRRRKSKRALELRLRGLRSDFVQISVRTQTKDIVVSQNGRKYFRRRVLFFDASSICIVISGGGWAALMPFSIFNILMGCGVGLLGCSMFLGRRMLQERKLKLLSRQFPEALDLMARGARVGVSVEESFRHIQKELPMPVRGVFRQISDSLNIGITFDESLKKAAEQIKLREVRYMAAILTVQRQSGSQYAHVIETLSKNIRDHHEQQNRIRVATSEARTAAKVVAGLAGAAALSMFLLNRKQFNFLLDDPAGQDMLIYSISSVLIGFFLIYRMLGTLNE